MTEREAETQPVRRPLDARAVGLVLVLCLIWGVQQVVMKAVSSSIAPVMQLAVRFAGSTVFFGVLVLRREGTGAFLDGTARSGLLMGVLFTLEFVLVGQALSHTTASHAIVFLYTAPVFTALGVQFLPDERMRRLQWLGVAVAFLGIVLAFAGPGSRPARELLLGDCLALLAGAAWGLTNVVLRRGRVGGAATVKTVFYQVGLAAPLLYVYALATGQDRIDPTLPALASVIFQTLMISIVSYLLWFWLLRHYLTSRLMLMTLLTPFVGVIFGGLALHDPIENRFAAGTGLVLAGIALVNAQWARRRERSESTATSSISSRN